MKLLTKEIMQKLPPLYAQDGKGDEAEVHAKLFTPDSNWTWYITEGSCWVTRDGEQVEIPYADVKEGEKIDDWRLFGLVSGFEVELGYVMLSELENSTGRMGLHIERDLYWNGKTIGDAKEEIASTRGAQ